MNLIFEIPQSLTELAPDIDEITKSNPLMPNKQKAVVMIICGIAASQKLIDAIDRALRLNSDPKSAAQFNDAMAKHHEMMSVAIQQLSVIMKHEPLN